MEIFLRIDSENTGPLTIYDVREMLRTGKATPDTKCWIKGMPEWVPLSEFPPLENDAELRVAGAGGEDIAVSDEEREAVIHTVLHPDQPRPWIRFWARSFDVSLYIVLLTWVADITNLADPRRMLLVPSLLVPVAIMLSWVVAEAALMACFKTTPGKWLLNIRVRRHDGEPLTGMQSLRRAFSVCWRGTCFSLFPFFIIGFALSNLSLATRGKTPWDLQGDIDVEHGSVGNGQVIAYIIATFAAASVLSYIIGPVEDPFNP